MLWKRGAGELCSGIERGWRAVLWEREGLERCALEERAARELCSGIERGWKSRLLFFRQSGTQAMNRLSVSELCLLYYLHQDIIRVILLLCHVFPNAFGTASN